MRLIQSKWGLIEDAYCSAGEDGKSTKFNLLFGAQWNVDRRIVGFQLHFKVDALEWDLIEMFTAAKESELQFGWPDSTDPMLNSQKNWEGMILSDQLYSAGYKDVDDIVKCLKKGGSPFFEEDRTYLGDFYRDSQEVKAFMDVVHDAVGPQDGWHHRIAPLLTAEGIKALKAKAVLKISTPQAKTAKKTLKERTDTM